MLNGSCEGRELTIHESHKERELTLQESCKERELTLQRSCKKRELILRDSCKERTNAAGVVFMKTIFPGLYLPWSDAQFIMTVDAVHD